MVVLPGRRLRVVRECSAMTLYRSKLWSRDLSKRMVSRGRSGTRGTPSEGVIILVNHDICESAREKKAKFGRSSEGKSSVAAEMR